MTESEYNSKRQEVISRFDNDFILSHLRDDDTLHNIVELLIRDKNPYFIIERLIEDRIQLKAAYKTYMELYSFPKIVEFIKEGQ